MKKRLRSTHRLKTELMAEINVTPFVDILLVLLIVFMISAPLLTNSLSIELPQGHLKEPSAKPEAPPLIVVVDHQEIIMIEKQKMSLPQLETRLQNQALPSPHQAVYLQLDKRVSHGFLIKLMLLFKNFGYRQVGLVFEEESA